MSIRQCNNSKNQKDEHLATCSNLPFGEKKKKKKFTTPSISILDGLLKSALCAGEFAFWGISFQVKNKSC